MKENFSFLTEIHEGDEDSSGYELMDKKENETVLHRSFDIKDANGNILCAANLDCATIPGMTNALRVRSFNLEHQGKIIDVLKLVGLKEPVPITMHLTAQRNYSYGGKDKGVSIPQLDTPVNIAIALHELGHAKQYESSFFKQFQGPRQDKTYSWEDDPTDKMDKLIAAFPEATPYVSRVPEETMGEIKDVRIKLAILKSKIEKVKKEYEERQDVLYAHISDPNDALFVDTDYVHPESKNPEWQKRKATLEAEFAVVQAERKLLEDQKEGLLKIFEEKSKPILELLKIPTRLKERDATRRAFQWMSRVEKEIDTELINSDSDNQVFGQPNEDNNSNMCVESTARVINIIRRSGTIRTKDRLLLALGSYDAFERLPVPNLKELENEIAARVTDNE